MSRERFLLIPDKYAMMLQAYYDETGDTTDEQQKFIGMAGFVAPAERWVTFEKKWKLILKEFKVDYFHMKEFAHSEGQFRGWKGNEKKRRSIFGSLLKTIAEIEPIPVGCIFSSEDFRSLPEKDQKRVEDPYFLSFISCVAIPCILLLQNDPEFKLATVFGEKGIFETRARGFYRSIQRMYEIGQRIYSPDFRDMREFVPLQAADIIAYELYKEADRRRYRPNVAPRHGIIEIVRMRERVTNRNIMIICKKSDLEYMIELDKKAKSAMLTGAALPMSSMPLAPARRSPPPS